MAGRGKNWAYTTLAEEASVRLRIEANVEGVTGTIGYEVVTVTGSFAVNQVPECVCVLAIGRNSVDGRQLAKIHKAAKTLKQMMKATVVFHPQGEFKPDGTPWPKGEQVVFDGRYAGLSYQKVNGKVSVCVHLTHWLVDLAFSSCLSSVSHVSNPASLTFPAALEPVVTGAGGGGEATFLSSLVPHQAIEPIVAQDLWEAMKILMCGMSSFDGFNPVCGTGGVGLDQLKKNDRAKQALKRIEGPGGDCELAYKYGKPLKLTVTLATQAFGGIAQAIGDIPVTSVWNMNFWDLLVGGYCPAFGLMVCPGVDRVIVAADCPGFRGAVNPLELGPGARASVWREIPPNEYEFTDQTAMLPRPLRAVVSHGAVFMEAGANYNATAQGVATCVSGVFASESVEDADGVVMYTQVPKWIAEVTTSGVNAGTVVGVKDNTPIKTATTPDGGTKGPDLSPVEMRDDAQKLLDKYAQMVFIREQLRGRNGTISGKLRFDIGPGSKLKLKGSPEVFIGGEDELADDLYVEVNRVTFEINCEGRRAATAFILTHARNDAENQSDRTSTDEHPFYGTAVMLGFPMLPAHDI